MSVRMTKAYNITAAIVSSECINLEATKPFFENRGALNKANKFCDTILKVVFRNYMLEDLL